MFTIGQSCDFLQKKKNKIDICFLFSKFPQLKHKKLKTIRNGQRTAGGQIQKKRRLTYQSLKTIKIKLFVRDIFLFDIKFICLKWLHTLTYLNVKTQDF